MDPETAVEMAKVFEMAPVQAQAVAAVTEGDLAVAAEMEAVKVPDLVPVQDLALATVLDPVQEMALEQDLVRALV